MIVLATVLVVAGITIAALALQLHSQLANNTRLRGELTQIIEDRDHTRAGFLFLLETHTIQGAVLREAQRERDAAHMAVELILADPEVAQALERSVTRTVAPILAELRETSDPVGNRATPSAAAR